MAQSPEDNAPTNEIIKYDLGWQAINAMLRSGRSLSGHERNCCFLNIGGGTGAHQYRFADISGAAGLDFPDDGRVLALADWDYDGDIDFWVANRSGPQIRLLRNNIAAKDSGTNFVSLRLNGVKCNRDAIGARVVVTANGIQSTQTLRAGEGYLSQSTRWMHFGLADSVSVDKVSIRWPDGTNDEFESVAGNAWYTIEQGGKIKPWQPPTGFKPLTESKFVAPPMTDKARIVLLAGIPLPQLSYTDAEGEAVSLHTKSAKPRLVNLWASWCKPCLDELTEWKEHADQLPDDLEIVAVNVDRPEEQSKVVRELLEQLDLPFKTGLATESLTQQFDVIQRSLLSRQRPLPVPSSFLIDRDGMLRVVYKGPVSVDVIASDAKLVNADRSEVLAAATPFEGRWYQPSGGSTPLQLTVKLIEGGHSDTAKGYVSQLVDSKSSLLTADLVNLLGAIHVDEKEYALAAKSFLQSLELDPNNRQAHLEVGELLLQAGQGARAMEHFEFAVKATPNDPTIVQKLGLCLLVQGKLDQARAQLTKSLELRPLPMTHWYLADIGIAKKDVSMAIHNYESALQLDPRLIVRSNNLAWLLATTDDDAHRDGERAVMVAEKLIQALESPKAENLDTLSAAYASAGRFDDAIKAAKGAVGMAKAEGNANLQQAMQKRLELYRQNKSLREKL